MTDGPSAAGQEALERARSLKSDPDASTVDSTTCTFGDDRMDSTFERGAIASSSKKATQREISSAAPSGDTGHPFISQDSWLPLASVFINRRVPPHRRSTLLFLEDSSDDGSVPIFFVRTDLLLDVIDLLQAHPTPFVLITASNDDHCPPYLHFPPSKDIAAAAEAFLEESNLVRWFAKNPCIVHPKLRPLPLGPKWQWSSTAFFGEPKAVHKQLFKRFGADPQRSFRGSRVTKPRLLFHNFRQTTKKCLYQPHRGCREACKTALLRNGFEWSDFTSFEEYLSALATHRFCAAPPGRGIDTHRAWEALMLGTVPILLRTPSVDSLFDGLPVAFVDDFSSVTAEWLDSVYTQLHALPDAAYDWSKLHSDHWVESIRAAAANGGPAAAADDGTAKPAATAAATPADAGSVSAGGAGGSHACSSPGCGKKKRAI